MQRRRVRNAADDGYSGRVVQLSSAGEHYRFGDVSAAQLYSVRVPMFMTTCLLMLLQVTALVPQSMSPVPVWYARLAELPGERYVYQVR